MKTKDWYVTTPIYYANSQPHIGSAYTTLAADIIARYYRAKLGKENVYFQVGTDEHGQKIAETAKKNGKEPKEFLDKLVPTFKKAWKSLNIDYDVFIRTTDPRHVKVASNLLQKIYDKGYIYKDVYEGLYCVGCESYITKKELVNERCPLHPNEEPRQQKERNYFFKLSDFAPKILDLIQENQVEILPAHRKKEIANRIKDGVEDISISRESVQWGIPIPWDKKQKSTLWVWIEALINYYSATQLENDKNRFWPADLHLVGKDILWFHTVVWFSLLLAADLPLPKTVFGHGFFTIDGQKISKSLGNVIAPAEFVKRYGMDGARFLIITAAPFGDDGDIKTEELDTKYNANLANGLGNLVTRVAGMAKNAGLKVEKGKKREISTKVSEAIKRFELNIALELIWKKIKEADILINDREVWALEGDEQKGVLTNLVGDIRQVATDLKPFLPETAEKILKTYEGPEIKAVKPLFPRIS